VPYGDKEGKEGRRKKSEPLPSILPRKGRREGERNVHCIGKGSVTDDKERGRRREIFFLLQREGGRT